MSDFSIKQNSDPVMPVMNPFQGAGRGVLSGKTHG
jgi:hypothetical protein